MKYILNGFYDEFLSQNVLLFVQCLAINKVLLFFLWKENWFSWILGNKKEIKIKIKFCKCYEKMIFLFFIIYFVRAIEQGDPLIWLLVYKLEKNYNIFSKQYRI